MPLSYEASPTDGPLRQCELLGDVWEHRPLRPASEDEGGDFPTRSIHHGMAAVMTPDCDLEWDYPERFPETAGDEPLDESNRSIVPWTILCDAFPRGEIRPLFTGQDDLFAAIRRNQNIRYHRLVLVQVDGGEDIPELFLDFKKTVAIPTAALYEGIEAGGIRRIGVVAPIYSHEVVHRFYNYQSRVALPD